MYHVSAQGVDERMIIIIIFVVVVCFGLTLNVSVLLILFCITLHYKLPNHKEKICLSDPQGEGRRDGGGMTGGVELVGGGGGGLSGWGGGGSLL